MTLREAIGAWRAGDAAACIDACDAASATGRHREAIAVLYARSLTRLRRNADALRILTETFGEGPWPAKARLLQRIALARIARSEDGIAALSEEGRQVSRRARAEVALALGLLEYDLRHFANARTALAGVPTTAGVLYSRALECVGWIDKAEGNVDGARAAFDEALKMLETASTRDLLLEANLLAIIGNLAVESLDIARWQKLETRWDTLGEAARYPAWARFWHAMNRSMAAEMDGRAASALHHAREAVGVAPSAAFALLAQCRRAEVLHAYGEMIGFADLASEIYDALTQLDHSALADFEEINVIAVVAETLALLGDAGRSRAVLQSLDNLGMDQKALLHDEPAKVAYLTATGALVDDLSGNTLRALHGARKAFQSFRDLGHARRAVGIALRIGTLAADPSIRGYLETTTSELPAASWVRARAVEIVSTYGDPTLAALSRSERDVLTMLCDGMSTADIAAARDRSAQTIRNTVSGLLRTFGVRSRSALLAECARRRVKPLDLNALSPDSMVREMATESNLSKPTERTSEEKVR